MVADAHPEVQAMSTPTPLALPSVRVYVQGWGRRSDAGVVAVDAMGHRLGAAWYRLFGAEAPGFGFVAPDVPEVALAVVAAARGRGLGTAMLLTLKALACAHGCAALSLAVERPNPARRLYERHGFRDTGLAPQDVTDTGLAPQDVTYLIMMASL